MDLRHLMYAAAAVGVLAFPMAALAEPDQNTNGQYNNQCVQWNNNGQCVRWNNQNGNWNNGNGNNGRGRGRDRDRDDRNGYGNNGYGNNGYGNNGYGRNGYGRGGQLDGSVSSFSPYNLYLNNGTHVELHNGTVINPTGINLSPGMRVHIVGNWNGDGSFNANEIDVAGRGYNRY